MGQVISDPCRTCGGDGRIQRAKTLAVWILQGLILVQGYGSLAGARLAFAVAQLAVSVLVTLTHMLFSRGMK